MRRLSPSEAERLLLDPKQIEYACNPFKNPAFLHADARTRDAHGYRLVDYMETNDGVRAAREWLKKAVRLPSSELEELLKQEPLKLSAIRKEGKKTRIVGVPTYRRRCLSNHIKSVLVSTVQHQLPTSVRAYLEDSPDAVHQAVLDVAEAAVGGKIRYWAKLDFSSYFPSMTWSSIERALRHYRCTERVVDIVMAMVRAPLVKVDRGELVPVPNSRGAQMGLAESPVLANMVPFELDEHFAAISSRVFCLRYSDDILVGSPYHHEVVGGVRAVMKWARRNGLRLKDVSPNQRAASLVKDARKCRIPFLGKEIDADGYIHIPADKYGEKLAEVRWMHQHRARGDVHGVSRYADGRGVELVDDGDICDVIDATLQDWEPLDPKSARRFAVDTDKSRYPLTTGAPGQEAVWHCQLGRPDGHGGGGLVPPCSSTQPLKPSPAPRSQVRKHVGLARPEPQPRGIGGTRSLLDVATEREGTSRIPDEDISLTWGEEHIVDNYYSSYGQLLADRFHAYLTEGTERVVSLGDDEGSTRFFPSGAGREPGEDEGEPPTSPRFKDVNAVHVHVEWMRREGLVLVGVADVQGPNGRFDVTSLRSRPEVALVRAIIGEVNRARSQGIVTLQVRLSEPWLAKHLLQTGRRFHAPRLFRAVLQLHETVKSSGIAVTLVGPVEPPDQLLRAMEPARHEAQLQEMARSNSATSPL